MTVENVKVCRDGTVALAPAAMPGVAPIWLARELRLRISSALPAARHLGVFCQRSLRQVLMYR